MKDNYFVDTDKFSLDKFRNILKTKEILPGRIVLKDKIEERFDLIKSKGVNSLSDLLDSLKTKQKIDKFSKETEIDIDYLTILRREANSYISVPVRLTEMPIIDTEIIDKLNSIGIKDSKHLFDYAAKRSDREKLANRCKLPIDGLTELVQLSDLVRITGVGPVFARIILDAGIGSVNDFLSIDAEDLFDRLIKTNNEKVLTKAKFTKKDIEYCLELGKNLPLVFEK